MDAGGHSLEFVARADQAGDTLNVYGYLTHISGIDDAFLFSPPTSSLTPPRGEANARFTFVATANFLDRFVNGNMVIGAQEETMTIYFEELPQAHDFASPETFALGLSVAAFQSRLQSILNVQTPLSAESPGKGILQLTSDSTQESATVFTIGSERYALGSVGHGIQVFATGEGTLTGVNPFAATFVFGGYAVDSVAAGSNRRLLR